MIHSRYIEPTYRMAHHGGSGEHLPGFARAWISKHGHTTAEIELSHDQYPSLEPHELTEKAVAILRRQTRQ